MGRIVEHMEESLTAGEIAARTSEQAVRLSRRGFLTGLFLRRETAGHAEMARSGASVSRAMEEARRQAFGQEPRQDVQPEMGDGMAAMAERRSPKQGESRRAFVKAGAMLAAAVSFMGISMPNTAEAAVCVNNDTGGRFALSQFENGIPPYNPQFWNGLAQRLYSMMKKDLSNWCCPVADIRKVDTCSSPTQTWRTLPGEKARHHVGSDWPMAEAAIAANSDGWLEVGNQPGGAGLYGAIVDRNGITTRVMHLDRFDPVIRVLAASVGVRKGGPGVGQTRLMPVRAGMIYGVSGNSGHSTGPHVHVDMKAGDKFIDSAIFMGASKFQYVPHIYHQFNANLSQCRGAMAGDLTTVRLLDCYLDNIMKSMASRQTKETLIRDLARGTLAEEFPRVFLGIAKRYTIRYDQNLADRLVALDKNKPWPFCLSDKRGPHVPVRTLPPPQEIRAAEGFQPKPLTNIEEEILNPGGAPGRTDPSILPRLDGNDGPAGQATSMNTSGFDRQLDADARASMARGNGVEMGNGMGSRM